MNDGCCQGRTYAAPRFQFSNLHMKINQIQIVFNVCMSNMLSLYIVKGKLMLTLLYEVLQWVKLTEELLKG